MRPISVFAKDAGSGIEQLEADLRASWTLRDMRPKIVTLGTNRKVTVVGRLR